MKQFSATALILAASLAGCAVGPDFHRPAAPASTSYSPTPLPAKTASAPVPDGQAQRFDPEKDIPWDWWTLFGSKQINSLIEHAFRANPTIAAAQSALRQAGQSVVAQQGFFFPSIGISYSPSRNKLAGNMGGNSPGIQGNGSVIATTSGTPASQGGTPPYNAPVYYNFHVAQLNVGFVPDVFGANSRAVESLRAQEMGQKFQLEATYITLAANVVAAALQEASLRAQIRATEAIVKSNEEGLKILKGQLRLGYASGIDLANQDAALGQARQALRQLQKQFDQTRDLVRALAGNDEDQEIPETFEISSIHLPQDLPLSLPSRIVEQRPDVRAAEEALHAASAQVGVAVANRLPQFAITGASGGMASQADWMFRSGGGFFSLIGSVSQSIFDGGTLSAREKMAREALVEAQASYRSTVITAFQNVADTLHAIEQDAGSLQGAARTEAAMKDALEITEKQYRYGLVNYQALLAARQNYQAALINLTQARVLRLGDTAALYMALGGGWWNRHGSS